MNNTELYIQSLHLLKTKANEPIIEGLIKGFSIIMESYGIETPNTNSSNPLDVAKATFENAIVIIKSNKTLYNILITTP